MAGALMINLGPMPECEWYKTYLNNVRDEYEVAESQTRLHVDSVPSGLDDIHALAFTVNVLSWISVVAAIVLSLQEYILG